MSKRLFRYDSERRTSPRYRAKRGLVRDVWIATGLTMLVLPDPTAVGMLALLTTFVSFMILDETQ
jgi:hypothetical protein